MNTRAFVDGCDGNCVRTATAVVCFYGAVQRCDAAQRAFDGIARQFRDAALLNALMTVLLEHERASRALALYREHSAHGICDDASHALAVQSGADLCALSVAPRAFSVWLSLSIIAQFGAEYALARARAIQNGECNENGAAPKWNAPRSSRTLRRVVGAAEKVQGARAATIEFHSHFRDIDGAQRVFEAMGDAERDSVCVNAMMKALIAHRRFDDALAPFHSFDSLRDSGSSLLAVRCCVELRDGERGAQIFEQMPTMRIMRCDLFGKVDEHRTHC